MPCRVLFLDQGNPEQDKPLGKVLKKMRKKQGILSTHDHILQEIDVEYDWRVIASFQIYLAVMFLQKLELPLTSLLCRLHVWLKQL